MTKQITLIVALFALFSCQSKNNEETANTLPDYKPEFPTLDIAKAEYLYEFAFHCIDQEYPNKLGHVLGNASSLKTPAEHHPCFYGCFDWHSAVHGHWTLVTLLSKFPDFEHHDKVLEKLSKNITKTNIENEIKYWNDPHNKTYERTYGWVWLLKLDAALAQWKHPKAKELRENLAPLTALISGKLADFLPKLIYPIRVGEHPNTAFALAFAYDYATVHDTELKTLIEIQAQKYFADDAGCPVTWEPGGFDFLSPCLQEAALMNKIMAKEDYILWLDAFLPGFTENPESFLEIAIVSDRSDGKLAHTDGLNFSRAWCLYEMGKSLENQKMIDLANKHFNASYNKMDSGEYAGAHWLASFALYALVAAE